MGVRSPTFPAEKVTFAQEGGARGRRGDWPTLRRQTERRRGEKEGVGREGKGRQVREEDRRKQRGRGRARERERVRKGRKEFGNKENKRRKWRR